MPPWRLRTLIPNSTNQAASGHLPFMRSAEISLSPVLHAALTIVKKPPRDLPPIFSTRFFRPRSAGCLSRCPVMTLEERHNSIGLLGIPLARHLDYPGASSCQIPVLRFRRLWTATYSSFNTMRSSIQMGIALSPDARDPFTLLPLEIIYASLAWLSSPDLTHLRMASKVIASVSWKEMPSIDSIRAQHD